MLLPIEVSDLWGMSEDERHSVILTVGVLLIAGLIRFGWEIRMEPPILPPEPFPQELLASTKEEVSEEERRGTPLGTGEKLDLNDASEIELDRLPGVGPALARRIIEHREGVGPFRSAEDLLEVSGIGPATLARIAPLINLGP
jgi:competence ComEA-like helix-hairpin-helix protein